MSGTTHVTFPHQGCRLLLVASLLFALPALSADRPSTDVRPLSSMDVAMASEITSLLREQLVATIRSQKGAASAHLLNSVTIQKTRNIVNVDLSSAYIPTDTKHYGSELEDNLGSLRANVQGILENELGFALTEVVFTFDGATIEQIYPADFATHQHARKAIGSVVVSAGHGAYLHHGATPDWRFQRGTYFGVLEDLVTQPLASELSELLALRSGVVTTFVRSYANTIHAPSQMPWNDISARYVLADQFPMRPDIWNSLPNATHALRERDEDIRARPFYANELSAETLISVHTNGDNTGTARGSRVYHRAGRAGDQAIANSMLCYMREIIQAQDGYDEFPVAATSHASTNHGENNHAQVPAVIVETAFHSNAADAAALLDPVFRTAAMKGVEKGFRLHRRDEPCEHFNVTSVPNVSGPWGTNPTVSIHYEGFPQHPIKLNYTNMTCIGGTCDSGEIIFNPTVQSSPLQFQYACNGTPDYPASQLPWRIHLTDADGVTTDEFDFTMSCGGGSGGESGHASTGGRPAVVVNVASPSGR